MGERRPLVVALGACGLDTIYRVPSSWQEGDASQKLLPTECVVVGEGMASSAAATVARLGGRAEIWGRVGDDGAGAQFSADMETSGVSTQHLRRVGGARTTISTILVSPDGERLVVPYCTRSSSLCVFFRPSKDAAAQTTRRWRLPRTGSPSARWPAAAPACMRTCGGPRGPRRS